MSPIPVNNHVIRVQVHRNMDMTSWGRTE
jgi:hypothetical protein